MARREGVEGTAFITATIRNNIPCTSRSVAVAFFARMEAVMRQQGGGCVNEGNNNGGRDVIKLAVTRAGIGWRDESVWQEAWMW